ncbi:MAG TPA: hypothetical protein VEY06_11485, partial [Flavisolibacter sp.]|nr:hypothetical protein [Flavisolibacter sp.]
MDSHPHKQQYGAEDFQRYHRGTMPAAERHALEKAALEDPFLGDALEGYVHTANADADAAELKKRLAVRLQKEPKVVPFGKKNSFHWLRIAAMFFV